MEEGRYYRGIKELKQVEFAEANALLQQGYELLAIKELITTEGSGKELKITAKPVYIFGKAEQKQSTEKVVADIDEKLSNLQWKKGKDNRSEIAPANEEAKQILANGKVEGKEYTYYLTKGGNVLRFKKGSQHG